MMVDRDLASMIAAAYSGPVSANRPIFEDGPARWYALTVSPLAEDRAESWLKQRGVYAFHPVQRVRKSVRGVVKEYDRRYLPQLVFAKFSGDPVVHEVLRCHWITGAICRGDKQWGILDPRSLRGLHSMRKIDTDAKVRKASMGNDLTFKDKLKVGDAALFASGMFKGFPCEVLEVQADGGARVAFKLFGRDVLASAAISELVAVSDQGLTDN